MKENRRSTRLTDEENENEKKEANSKIEQEKGKRGEKKSIHTEQRTTHRA